MTMSIPRSLLVSALDGLSFAGVAFADYGPLLTIEQLADSSRLVVTGRVYSVDSGWDRAAASIYTYVAIDVEEVIRGEVPAPRIVLKQLGGVVGDVGLAVGGQPGFVPGEQVLTFLQIRPRDRTLQTAELWQGKWTIEPRDGGPTAIRHAGRDAAGLEVAYRELNLGALQDRVRRRAGSLAPMPAEPIQFRPPEAPRPVNTVDSVEAIRKIPLLGWSWQEAFSGSTIPVNFHKQKHATAGSGKKQVRGAWKSWNAVKKILKFWSKGKRIKTAATGSGPRPGAADVLIQNGDPLEEISDTSSTLAIGGAWVFSGPMIRGLVPAFSGFVIINDSASAEAFMANKTCYQTVVAHELGHDSGLGHSDKSGSLMAPGANQANCNAGIPQGPDDKKFYKKIYNKKFLARDGS